MKTLYIQSLVNNTLRSGIEIPMTSAIVREFVRGGRIKLVSRESEADAVLSGQIDSFGSDQLNHATAPQVANNDLTAQAIPNQLIASEYIARANITVNLTRKDGKGLWAQAFGRPKVYPAGNLYGLQGTTSALRDASFEQFALADIAAFIASDIYDTMMEAF